MKKQLLLALGLTAGLFTANAQERQCASHEVYEQQLRTNPQFAENQAQIERNTAEFARKFAEGRMNGSQIVIPCIVHVVYANSTQNISLAQVESQINRLNLDYGATNGDYSKTPSEFQSVRSGDTGIRFELMEVKRYSNSRAEWGTNDLVKSTYPPIEPARILNIWVCNIGGGILGYAQFPGGAASTDGVVISPNYFGDAYGNGTTKNTSFYLSSPFDRGRTGTHEVGHWLNLRHIWGDGPCSADDFVSDTPRAGAANYGCPGTVNSCTSYAGNDMTMNYMDYTDDACMYMFSAGQETRMLATFNSGGGREGFKLNPVYVPGGTGGGGTTPTPVCGTASSISVSKGTWKYYTVTIPSGTASWTVTTTGSNGDADLYVRQGTSNPTLSTFTAKSDGANSNETITRTNPAAGTWKIGIYGYAAASGITLKSCTTASSGRMTEVELTEEAEFSGFAIYPNPASDVLHIQVSSMKGTSVQVYSMSGQLVKQAILSETDNSVDVSDLGAGVYILKAVNNEGTFTERFIKQ